MHVLNGCTFIFNRVQILAFPHMTQGPADTIMILVEDWARNLTVTPEHIDDAKENLGWMVVAREAGCGQMVAIVGHPMAREVMLTTTAMQPL